MAKKRRWRMVLGVLLIPTTTTRRTPNKNNSSRNIRFLLHLERAAEAAAGVASAGIWASTWPGTRYTGS